jgi:hypothetical protein
MTDDQRPDDYVWTLPAEAADYVQIRINRTAIARRSSTADLEDRNWLPAEIELKTGAFHGAFSAALRAEELAVFASELRQLCDTLKGQAELASMERQLELLVTADRLGQLSMVGTARDAAGEGNALQFSITLDQSVLGPVVDELGLLVKSFPPEA